jgi:hypothetical protein
MIRSRLPGLGVVVAVGVVAFQALLVPLFAAPAAGLEARDLPIAVAGSPSAVAVLKARLDDDAFGISAVPDAASVDAGIKDRSVYGGIVLTPQGVTMRVASAGSPATAALLTRVAADLGAVAVVDVVPIDPGDSRSAAVLPLAITAALAGVLMFLLVHGRGPRLAGLIAFGVLAGLTGAAVQQFSLSMLPGDYVSDSAAIGLGAFAIAAAVTGLGALFGRGGVIVGVVLFVLVGSALAAAPELSPQPWGTVGRYLPVAAGVTLLRSVAYFRGSGATPEAAMLLAYAIGGLVMVSTGRHGVRPRGDSTEGSKIRPDSTPFRRLWRP